jgi:hypothetical protein
MEAGQLISAAEAELRVLILQTPPLVANPPPKDHARPRRQAFPARAHAAGAHAQRGLLSGHVAAIVDVAGGQSAPRTRNKTQ